VVDDDPDVLDLCDMLLERAGYDRALAGSGEEAVSLLEDRVPSLIVLDLNMPGMDGTAGLRRLREELPTLPVVVASGQDDAATIRAVLAAGAAGFISKSERPEVLLSALRLVLAGGIYVPARSLDAPAAPTPASAAALLTPRQRDVLLALSRGQPNKLIARELDLTEGTVKIHIAAILRALQARNRTEAVVRARALGLDAPAAGA
jgi:DNA-binding NarL/FixJ family response regulator